MRKQLVKQLKDNNQLAYVIGGLLIGLSLIISPFNSDIFSANHFLFKTYFAMVLLGGLAIWQLYQTPTGKFKLTPTPIKIILLGLLLLGLLSIVWANNADFALGKWLVWANIGLLVWLSLSIKTTQANFVILAVSMTIGAVIIAIIGLLQVFGQLDFIRQTVPPASTMVNKNIASHSLVMMLPMALYLLSVDFKRTWKNTLTPIGIALILALVFHIQSRTSWLSLGIFVLIVFVYLMFKPNQIRALFVHQRHNLWANLFAMGLFLVLISFSKQGFTPLTQVIDTTTETMISLSKNPQQFSQTGRYQIFISALAMIKQAPLLGTGLGSFSHNIANEGYGTISLVDTQRVHNDFLELGVELGLVGLMMLLVFIVLLLKGFIKLIKHTQAHQHWWYFLCLTALMVSGINAVLSYPYQVILPLALFGLYTALLIKGMDELSNKSAMTITLYPVVKYSLLLVLSLLLFAQITLNQSWIKFYTQINTYLLQIQNNQPNRVLSLSPLSYNFYMLNSLSGIARQLQGFNKPSDALAFYQAILTVWPNYHWGLLASGNILFNQGKHQPALSYALSAIKVAPSGDYSAYNVAISCYYSLGKLTQAIELYQVFAQQDEKFLSVFPSGYYDLHQKAILLKQPPNQIAKHYEKYQKYHGTNATLASDTAVIYLRAGQLQKAIIYMRQTVFLAPEQSNAKEFKRILINYDAQKSHQ